IWQPKRSISRERAEAFGIVDEAQEEFLARRDAIVEAADERPLSRVAALLLAISRNNAYEGRDPRIIPDSLTSGFVADLLDLDIDALQELLVDLRLRGFVAVADKGGLRLADIDGLELLAEEA